jgi:hypothetical protein
MANVRNHSLLHQQQAKQAARDFGGFVLVENAHISNSHWIADAGHAKAKPVIAKQIAGPDGPIMFKDRALSTALLCFVGDVSVCYKVNLQI